MWLCYQFLGHPVKYFCIIKLKVQGWLHDKTSPVSFHCFRGAHLMSYCFFVAGPTTAEEKSSDVQTDASELLVELQSAQAVSCTDSLIFPKIIHRRLVGCVLD